jgi:hypothetical protein
MIFATGMLQEKIRIPELLETPLKNLSSLTRTKIGPHGSNLKPLETG